MTGTPALSRRLSNHPFGQFVQLFPAAPPEQQEVTGETMKHRTRPTRAARAACWTIFFKIFFLGLWGVWFLFICGVLLISILLTLKILSIAYTSFMLSKLIKF
jgi:hypothetical protein